MTLEMGVALWPRYYFFSQWAQNTDISREKVGIDTLKAVRTWLNFLDIFFQEALKVQVYREPFLT